MAEKDCIIGFFDESSPQTTSNTQKVWSLKKAEFERALEVIDIFDR